MTIWVIKGFRIEGIDYRLESVFSRFFVENWENTFMIFKFTKEKMLVKSKKRVRLSIDEKLWILNHRKENPKITHNKIALHFLNLCFLENCVMKWR